MSQEEEEEEERGGDGAAFLTSPPAGFARAVQALDMIPPADLEELASQVCKHILNQRGAIFSEADLASRMAPTLDARESASTSPPALLQARQAINAATHMFREAARRRASPQEFAEGVTTSGLSQGSCAVLARVFRQRAPALAAAENVKASLSIGTLDSFDWRLAVGTQSSETEVLNAPHVTLRFRVADPSAKVASHSVEMTIQEFEAFAAQVAEMSAVLETL